MILIAHRGNLDGPSEFENRPDYLLNAIDQGFDVEIDVWKMKEKFYFGHNEPQYESNINFSKLFNCWFHCKNIEALEYFCKYRMGNYFWHQNDDYAIVQPDKYIWTYPGKQLIDMSIVVMPELVDYTQNSINKCVGICSDYITRYE
jgi:hypothetical protein